MASHEQNINNLKNARYGKDVRNSMIELFNEDYNLVKNGIAAGTDVNGPSSSTEGYSDGNVYINTDTLDIYKLENDTWTNKGNLKGIKTITTEETTDDDGFNAVTFELTNGWQKTFHIKNGSKGSRGNGITGVTSERSGARVTYTLHFTDGDDYSFDVVDGTGASWEELTEKPFEEIKDTYLDVVDNKLTIKGLSIDESALDYSVNQKLNLGSYDDKWDPEHEYKKDDICIKNNRLYISKVNDNFMNDPEYDTSATYWKRTTYKDVISDLKNTLTPQFYSAGNALELNFSGLKRSTSSVVKIDKVCFAKLKFWVENNNGITLQANTNIGYMPQVKRNGTNTYSMQAFYNGNVSLFDVDVDSNGNIITYKKMTTTSFPYTTIFVLDIAFLVA